MYTPNLHVIQLKYEPLELTLSNASPYNFPIIKKIILSSERFYYLKHI